MQKFFFQLCRYICSLLSFSSLALSLSHLIFWKCGGGIVGSVNLEEKKGAAKDLASLRATAFSLMGDCFTWKNAKTVCACVSCVRVRVCVCVLCLCAVCCVCMCFSQYWYLFKCNSVFSLLLSQERVRRLYVLKTFNLCVAVWTVCLNFNTRTTEE